MIGILTATALIAPGSTASAQTPAQAVASAVGNASSNGVTSFISVVDRKSGAVLSQTGNAGSQVASESIMKLFLAAYYLRSYGGYSRTPQNITDRLQYMLIYSDDGTASSMFTSSAIPTISAVYGLGSTINATDRVGHWGAARITAADMTRFLYRAEQDPEVGPWLIPVMAQTAANGSDNFDQYFGMNRLTGEHGSKQGWGCDSFWTSPQCAIHSVGYTDRYLVAILQLGGYPDPMRWTSTTSAGLIAQSSVQLRNGDFICEASTGRVFRLAGGAPIHVSTWTPFGRQQQCSSLSPAQFAALPRYPAEGTFLRDPVSGAVYRTAGGAPVYVSTWSAYGGVQPTIDIDPAAISRAGGAAPYDHLRYYPADGTFVRGTSTQAVYRIAGGAPVYVSTWSAFGGGQPTVDLDNAAIERAGSSTFYKHLRFYPADGTFIRASGTRAVYRIAGGAPLLVTSWVPFGVQQPTTLLDSVAIEEADSRTFYQHLRYFPADGTFLEGRPGGRIYRVQSRVATYVPSWDPWGGQQPFTGVNQQTIDRAGSGGAYNHLGAAG